jgi:hypothetical protein
LPGRKIQTLYIGHLGDLGPGSWKSFFVSSSGQPGKPFFFEDQRDRNGADLLPALLQDPADIIDGEILLSQGHDLVPDSVGFRRSLGPLLRGKEEGTIGILTELVGQDAEASRRIPEATGDLDRREILNEVGPEGFVLAVSRIAGFEKKASHIC